MSPAKWGYRAKKSPSGTRRGGLEGNANQFKRLRAGVLNHRPSVLSPRCRSVGKVYRYCWQFRSAAFFVDGAGELLNPHLCVFKTVVLFRWDTDITPGQFERFRLEF